MKVSYLASAVLGMVGVVHGKTFAVVHQQLGDCFVSDAGNLNEVSTEYTFDLPKNLPSSKNAVFAWTYVNPTQDAAFFMNCADVEIVGANTKSFSGPEMTILNYNGKDTLANQKSISNGKNIYDNAKIIEINVESDASIAKRHYKEGEEDCDEEGSSGKKAKDGSGGSGGSGSDSDSGKKGKGGSGGDDTSSGSGGDDTSSGSDSGGEDDCETDSDTEGGVTNVPVTNTASQPGYMNYNYDYHGYNQQQGGYPGGQYNQGQNYQGQNNQGQYYQGQYYQGQNNQDSNHDASSNNQVTNNSDKTTEKYYYYYGNGQGNQGNGQGFYGQGGAGFNGNNQGQNQYQPGFNGGGFQASAGYNSVSNAPAMTQSFASVAYATQTQIADIAVTETIQSVVYATTTVVSDYTYELQPMYTSVAPAAKVFYEGSSVASVTSEAIIANDAAVVQGKVLEGDVVTLPTRTTV
ncbi:hypothetical protein IWW56_002446 [Coemansia sp. RSA 2131]|nr:hypothetical protein IWW56_002446 [Coemansia sp. RSA 2131]